MQSYCFNDHLEERNSINCFRRVLHYIETMSPEPSVRRGSRKKPVRLAEMTLDIKLWQKSNDLPFPAASLNNGVLKSVSTTRQVPDNFRTWYNSGKSWFRQHQGIGLRPHDFIKLSFCFCHNISLNHKNSRAKISPRSMPADSGKLGTASRFWAFVGVQSATSKCEKCTLGINGKIPHRHLFLRFEVIY